MKSWMHTKIVYIFSIHNCIHKMWN